MENREIFDSMCRIVEDVTEIPVDDMVGSCRREEVVDARYLLVMFLRIWGLYPSQIARLTGHSVRNVNHTLASFPERMSRQGKQMSRNYQLIKRQLGSLQETTIL